MGSNIITHKEPLTFCNLTNLHWHLVELDSTGDDEGRGEKILNKLLTPEVFVKYNAQSDTYSYPYLKNKFGENITLSNEEREQGLAEMRKRAGIAMEYLEKWKPGENEEGSFIGDWEVIYVADNYNTSI